MFPLFYIIFLSIFPSSSFFPYFFVYPYFFFFASFFPLFSYHFLHTRCPYFFFSLFPCFVFFPTTSHSITIHTKLSSFFLFLFIFSFFLYLFSLATLSASFFPFIPSKRTNLKVTHNHTIWFSSIEDREMGLLIGHLRLSPLSSSCFASVVCWFVLPSLCRLSSSPMLLDLFPNQWHAVEMGQIPFFIVQILLLGCKIVL